MERRYAGSTWEDYFSEDPDDIRVEDVAWRHWPPHRALMWTRSGSGYHPLDGDFLTRIRESAVEGWTRWKALVTPNDRLVGTAVLRRHDRWGEEKRARYVLDMYVHPRFETLTDLLYEAAMPEAAHVQTFLDGASEEKISFFLRKGFALEARLRDDFNHHDDTTPDICVYGKIS